MVLFLRIRVLFCLFTMKSFSKFLVFLCFLGLGMGLHAQISFGIKFMGLSLHPKRSLHPHLYKRKLDRWGHGVVNMGVVFQVEYFVNEHVSIKYSQAILQDCAGKFAGLSHVGMRLGFFMDPRQQHYASGGLGPTFFYRKNWTGMDRYVNTGLFETSKNGKWQSKFVLYGGEVEYSYYYADHSAFSTTIMPAIPELIAIAPGFKWYGPPRNPSLPRR